MHLAQHLFDDIEAKGATRNYTTKTFEKLHGPLKESYLRRTNFKDIARQVSQHVVPHYSPLTNFYYKILKVEHQAQISALIRSQINLLDAYQARIPENDWDVDGEEDSPSGDANNNPNNAAALPHSAPSTSTIWRSDDHFILGSYQGVRTIGRLLQKSAGDAAFTSFLTRLSVAIKDLDPTNAVMMEETSTVCN
jgi:hypothetical protein